MSCSSTCRFLSLFVFLLRKCQVNEIRSSDQNDSSSSVDGTKKANADRKNAKKDSADRENACSERRANEQQSTAVRPTANKKYLPTSSFTTVDRVSNGNVSSGVRCRSVIGGVSNDAGVGSGHAMLATLRSIANRLDPSYSTTAAAGFAAVTVDPKTETVGAPTNMTESRRTTAVAAAVKTTETKGTKARAGAEVTTTSSTTVTTVTGASVSVNGTLGGNGNIVGGGGGDGDRVNGHMEGREEDRWGNGTGSSGMTVASGERLRLGLVRGEGSATRGDYSVSSSNGKGTNDLVGSKGKGKVKLPSSRYSSSSPRSAKPASPSSLPSSAPRASSDLRYGEDVHNGTARPSVSTTDISAQRRRDGRANRVDDGCGRGGNAGLDAANAGNVSISTVSASGADGVGHALSELTRALASTSSRSLSPSSSVSLSLGESRGTRSSGGQGITTFEAEESGVLRALLSALLAARHGAKRRGAKHGGGKASTTTTEENTQQREEEVLVKGGHMNDGRSSADISTPVVGAERPQLSLNGGVIGKPGKGEVVSSFSAGAVVAVGAVVDAAGISAPDPVALVPAATSRFPSGNTGVSPMKGLGDAHEEQQKKQRVVDGDDIGGTRSGAGAGGVISGNTDHETTEHVSCRAEVGASKDGADAQAEIDAVDNDNAIASGVAAMDVDADDGVPRTTVAVAGRGDTPVDTSWSASQDKGKGKGKAKERVNATAPLPREVKEKAKEATRKQRGLPRGREVYEDEVEGDREGRFFMEIGKAFFTLGEDGRLPMENLIATTQACLQVIIIWSRLTHWGGERGGDISNLTR